jgi:hypothetical protein
MAAANIIPTAQFDGIDYSVSVPLTSNEADLFGGVGAQGVDPVPVLWGQVILAIVQLKISGSIATDSCYIVMQTDFGDGIWIDVAWIVSTLTTGTQTFVLCGGNNGAANNAFQQTRAAGTAPGSNGSNAMPLGGRIRFVGKATTTGGSSSAAPGVAPGVQASISYKLGTPR